MDIRSVNSPADFGVSASVAQTNAYTQAVPSTPDGNAGNNTNRRMTDPTDDNVSKKPAMLQDVEKMTDAMNQFVEAMNSTIRFAIHQKTNELMVQVVDLTTNKVIKEFPSKEFLDTVAAIRNYVGVLLDKKV